jgi:putative Mg2+ transporter-C (MgtC) family protein
VESVTQGVAFLAAGLVVFSRGEVRGLTTGASLWLAAAVGLACGLGLWLLAATTTVLALVVIRLLKIGERALGTEPPPDEEDGLS